MFKNYWISTIRSLRRSPVFSFINVIGLSIGLAAFVLITVFVRDELTFDKFHTNVDRIYRGVSVHEAGFVFGVSDRLIELAQEQIPELEKSARMDFGGRAIVRYNDEMVFENESYTADPEIFEIFDFSLLYGNESEALIAENSLVISQYIMNKYFEGENPVGQPFKFGNNEKSYIITGVLNSIPKNSRFQFNFIKPFAKLDGDYVWEERGVLYALFSQPIDPNEFSAQLTKIGNENGYESIEQLSFSIENFGELYLESEKSFTASGVGGDKQFITTFSLIGVLLLAIACINYVNSSTAKSISRLKEIGVRKVIGANQKQIRRQFLLETFVLTLVALCIAAGLAEAALPAMNELAGKGVSLDYFGDPFYLAMLLILLPSVTVLAGTYPSFYASRFSALKIFRGEQKKSRGRLRRSLVVTQFVITLVLIFSTQIIRDQMDMFFSGDIGVNSENVVIANKPRKVDYKVVKSTLESIPGVDQVVSSPLPNAASSSLIPIKWTGEQDGELLAYYSWVSEGFGKALGVQILSGRDFEDGNTDDFNNSILVSEAVAKKLSWEEPVGQMLTVKDRSFNDVQRKIIGVYKDIDLQLKTEAPLVVMFPSQSLYKLNIKLNPLNQAETIARITELWNQEFTEAPFEYSYLDDEIMSNYEKEQKFGEVFGYFSMVAILIAALGLFGLSVFTIVHKRKEISIRKVLGASVGRLVLKFLRSYFVLIAIASLIAIPAAYYFMDSWLSDFANRIQIELAVFAVGIAVSMLIVIVTVGFQSIKAARSNPASILRDE